MKNNNTTAMKKRLITLVVLFIIAVFGSQAGKHLILSKTMISFWRFCMHIMGLEM
ncbi:hypothetical protein [Anaerostipes sp. 992a]|uniref:hypothetical protein n=1 Tax=Anaerostipes sp. 992a TaxID=1261637 RepID=UPI001301786E|nr:hypothetical protein [Anaerostipes sp. 992a]